MDSQEPAAKRTIVCFGDSNTWGAAPGLARDRYPIHVRWPGAVHKLLRAAGYRVVEAGLCGRTSVFDDPVESAFGIERNGSKLLGTTLSSHAPVDLLIIKLGANDLKYRFSATPTDIACGVGALVQAARSPAFGPGLNAVPDVLVICPPSIWEVESSFGPMFKGGREKSLALPSAFSKMGKTFAVPVLFADDCIHVDPQDGIHYSAESHGILAAEIVRWVLERHSQGVARRSL